VVVVVRRRARGRHVRLHCCFLSSAPPACGCSALLGLAWLSLRRKEEGGDKFLQEYLGDTVK
jgi:hypothetical protein